MKEHQIKDRMLKGEIFLTEYATKDKDAIRIKPYQADIRPNYFRDIDRIIHTLSYTRYIDKTQVFSINSNDNISKRMIHVQLVSKIAKTIGRALNLNEDLIEAIALGHDIGHVPFGHVGEEILNHISKKYHEGPFMHNVQSVRTLMEIERNGEGLNLTIQVLDGILCHNGEFVEGRYYPQKKTLEQFLNQYQTCYQKDMHKEFIPMTLEGCVVRVSDIIGYIGRDIEDALMLGIIKKEELPNEITNLLGNNNREMINTIILDIIQNSYDKPYIELSKPIYSALKNLKKYNFEHIYLKANNKEQIQYYETMFHTVFDYYFYNLETEKESDIYTIFLNQMSQNYRDNTTKARKVIDYIAGMTDDFLIRQYKQITQEKDC